MSKKKQQDQHRTPKEQTGDDEQAHRGQHEHDLIEYDPEKAQDMIDVEEAAEQASQVHEPHRDDPQHPKQGVPPGQENVPSGFTSGRGMQGGSSNRRKR